MVANVIELNETRNKKSLLTAKAFCVRATKTNSERTENPKWRRFNQKNRILAQYDGNTFILSLYFICV